MLYFIISLIFFLSSQTMIGMPPSNPSGEPQAYPHDNEWRLVLDNKDMAGISKLVGDDKEPSPQVLSKHLITKTDDIPFKTHLIGVIKYFSYKHKGWMFYGKAIEDAMCEANSTNSVLFYSPKSSVEHMLQQDALGKTNYDFLHLKKNLTKYLKVKQDVTPQQQEPDIRTTQGDESSLPIQTQSDNIPKQTTPQNITPYIINQSTTFNYGRKPTFVERHVKAISIGLGSCVIAYCTYIKYHVKKVHSLIDNPKAWMNWKNLSIETLKQMPRNDLLNQLAQTMFDTYTEPQFIDSDNRTFIQGMKDMMYEKDCLEWLIKKRKSLQKWGLNGICGINDDYIKKCKERLEKVTYLNDFFLKWYIKSILQKPATR